MTEEEFLRSTLKKICGLLDVHSKVNNTSENSFENKKENSKGKTVTLKCIE